MRAVAGENDDLDGIVLHRLVEGGVEVVGHLQVLRVARLGPVHHDPRNARVGPFHHNGLEWHRTLPVLFCYPAMLLFRQMIGKGEVM